MAPREEARHSEVIMLLRPALLAAWAFCSHLQPLSARRCPHGHQHLPLGKQQGSAPLTQNAGAPAGIRALTDRVPLLHLR